MLVQAVAATGGAVGWLEVPPAHEVRAWVDGLAGSRTALLRDDDDRLVACATWARHPHAVLAHDGEVRKVMVHPSERGKGLGRVVVAALVDDAREAGVEVLTLDCRGNNHAALRLYAGLGFVTTGRRPDFIAVGEHRFDQVLLHLDLRAGRRSAAGALTRHGGRREGPGAT